MTTSTCCNIKKLVRWSIVSLRSGDGAKPEDQGQDLISGTLSEAEFHNWLLVRYAQDHPKLSPDAGKYLRVYSQVLDCFEGESWDFEEAQIAVLEEIRNAIAGEHPHHKVRLPKTGVVAGPLLPEINQSDFGDEFVNMPPFMGEHPNPGHTILSGWVEVIFKEPQGDAVDFLLNWFGVGTPVQITFGGGQQFDFLRTRTFPLPFLPDMTPVQTTGKLNLVTGEVEALQIFATFQGTAIARTDKVNRIPYAFPYIFPPLPIPDGFVPPPDYRPPNPMPPVFGTLSFSYDGEGNITGLALHSETFAPVGLFPYLSTLFPPFTFGPDHQFHFASPDRCLPGTPPENCLKDDPDGTLTSSSVYFHPHLDLVSEAMAEVPLQGTPPPATPAAVASAALVAAQGKLYQIGGFGGKGKPRQRVDVYDPATNAWHDGPALPTAVAAAQAAAVGHRIFVCGGWTDAEKTPADLVQILDLDSGTWSKGPALPVAVAGGTATAVDGRIYVISGWTGDGGGGRKLSAAVQVLDARNGTWSKGADAAIPAAGASAVAVGRKIYVVGGRILGDQVTRRTALYDLQADAWAGGPDTLTGVFDAAIGHLGERLFLVGGRTELQGAGQQIVQELDLAANAWRPGVPPLAPVAAAGAAVLGGALYVSGGRTMLAADPAPGAATSAVQLFLPARGWIVSGEAPVLSLSGVYFGTGAQYLAPGELALLLGQNFATPGAPPASFKIRVGGLDAMVLPPAAGPLPPQILPFVVPPDLDPAPGRATLEVIKEGASQQAPPLEIPIAPAAPVLFVFNYGELAEPTYLDNAGAMACNEDGSLNCANQPAKPGQALSLWATGLGKTPTKDNLKVRMGGKNAKVDAVNPPPAPLPGVYLIRVIVPDGVPFASYVPTTVTADGKVTSNRVGVAIRAEVFRTTPPIPCAAGLPAVFPGFPPPPKP